MELEFEWRWLASTVYSTCYSNGFHLYLNWYSSAGCVFLLVALYTLWEQYVHCTYIVDEKYKYIHLINVKFYYN